MKQIVLEKLDWSHLTGILAKKANTLVAQDRCHNLKPDLNRGQVETHWNIVEPLKELIKLGYSPPIGELQDMTAILRSIEVGQVLSGQEMRAIHSLLIITKHAHRFCTDFAPRCSSLKIFKARTYPLPNLTAHIEKTIGPDGELLDDASSALLEIRKGKVNLRKKIEHKIKALLHDEETQRYLQDDFFTIRSERYVVPMKLDGRGRIKGSIYDTSDSGQTLFIEPASIAPLNEELQELDLSEKLEIIRIFRELGDEIKKELDIIRENYEQIIELDFITAQAHLAAEWNCGRVKLSNEAKLNLVNAVHPLVKSPTGENATPNIVSLKPDQTILVISGPNAGGKTVVLKAVGLIQLMAKAGLLVPADPESEIFLFSEIHLEMGDSQSITANLSTFSGHIKGLKPIIEESNSQSLVLLDELAAGTEPQAGAAIAQAMLESLARSKAHCVVTTHYDTLKSLAIRDQRFRNGSMEYSTNNFRPTYNLILDIPGQSYGIEVAEQMGLPKDIIERSRELRGNAANELDQLISDLNNSREELNQMTREIKAKAIEADAAKSRWEEERALLKQARSQVADKLANRYDGMIDNLKDDYHEVVDALKKKFKDLQKQPQSSSDHKEFIDLRHQADAIESRLHGAVKEVEKTVEPSSAEGKAASITDLQVGMTVYVDSLQKKAQIIKVLAHQTNPQIEIQMGLIKAKVAVKDVRIPQQPQKKSPSKTMKTKVFSKKDKSKTAIPLTLQTKGNSLDLRGRQSIDAVELTYKFIDDALLAGEPRVLIIHGHGHNKLKIAIRVALTENCPYNIRIRPGEDEEGGDGVTVVALDQ